MKRKLVLVQSIPGALLQEFDITIVRTISEQVKHFSHLASILNNKCNSPKYEKYSIEWAHITFWKYHTHTVFKKKTLVQNQR